ncbi:hypothetical protein SDRG_02869 [Saprolegnia diclina VS20]|uniref:Uncharacterized protein n=1 Tax=Saprolegnia diclina (strain VS20) TaxID=1156394 RepID=T0QZT6_SAPDV|nr:hypothetical protein SDRG_02869 [Saprolegnia diclina VS20]EQC40221.1 hypothetical protein SDRG_02869 [Saprolegnia diclina VS20]|eukprot:XP_008606695.1 hypothetical protein SDRG_02869 [Saprolegnia diclina VS20]
MECYFNGCEHPARTGETTCDFHKHRRACIVPDCHNQVFARQRCVRHGGKRQCTAPNCSANARKDGVCARHGARIVKRVCMIEGCTNVAHRDNKCIRHGGRRPCKIDGCETHARSRGYCWRHRPASLTPNEDAAGTDGDDVFSNDDSSVSGGDNVNRDSDKNGVATVHLPSLDVTLSESEQYALAEEYDRVRKIDWDILNVLCHAGFSATMTYAVPMNFSQ